MGKINCTRVLIGGLIAGVVLNVLFVCSLGAFGFAQFERCASDIGPPDAGDCRCHCSYGRVGLPDRDSGHLVLSASPRYGAGPKTAALAGVLRGS